jgi:hypothetical protein
LGGADWLRRQVDRMSAAFAWLREEGWRGNLEVRVCTSFDDPGFRAPIAYIFETEPGRFAYVQHYLYWNETYPAAGSVHFGHYFEPVSVLHLDKSGLVIAGRGYVYRFSNDPADFAPETLQWVDKWRRGLRESGIPEDEAREALRRKVI